MKIKDKKGNSFTFKEFVSKWKSGINGITPLQQIKSQMLGMRIMIFGMASGLFICLTSLSNLWWLGIILSGGLFNTYIQYIGLKQKKNMFESFENIGENETKNN